ncbi:protocatechuate 3,4-dioxygenase subunit alpha, partial [Pseudomonas fluorescens BRIP34879]
FFQAEDGIRDTSVTGVQTCALPIAYHSEFDPDRPFNGFGRTATTDDGQWILKTIKPGSARNAAGVPMAAHINVSLFARGINIHLQTRLYFDDEAQANA